MEESLFDLSEFSEFVEPKEVPYTFTTCLNTWSSQCPRVPCCRLSRDLAIPVTSRNNHIRCIVRNRISTYQEIQKDKISIKVHTAQSEHLRFGHFGHFNGPPFQLQFSQRNQSVYLFNGITIYGRTGRPGTMTRRTASVRFLDIHFGGINTTWHWTMHIPKCTLLRIQYLTFELITFFIDFALGFSLGETGFQ